MSQFIPGTEILAPDAIHVDQKEADYPQRDTVNLDQLTKKLQKSSR
tara:strand:+ start:1499 stop:1636 length:138 start_codon:yes stop_codon:yes gene_type:complete